MTDAVIRVSKDNTGTYWVDFRGKHVAFKDYPSAMAKAKGLLAEIGEHNTRILDLVKASPGAA